MAPRCAAAPRTLRRPQVLVWSCIPTRQDTASDASPSCTALTVTTTSRPSPCLEILPYLGNSKSSEWLRGVEPIKCPLGLWSADWSVSFQAWGGLDSDSICAGENASMIHSSAETVQFFLTPSGLSRHWSQFLENYPSSFIPSAQSCRALLEALSAVTGRRQGDTLDRSWLESTQNYSRAVNKHMRTHTRTHTHTYGKFRVPSSPHMNVFGL